MSVGVLYAWDFLFLAITTIAYYLCPSRFISKKSEYVKFALTFLSVYFTLFLIVKNCIHCQEATDVFFKVCFVPTLFIAHWVWPFRKQRRNQHLTFFLLFASLYILGLGGVMAVAIAFSNM